MNLHEFNTKLWMYYMHFEKEFYHTMDFVELSRDNYNTYSKEYSKLLLSICSEIDVVCKILCNEVAPEETVKNINEYARVLCGYENITTASVKCKLLEGEHIPFDGWAIDNSPDWWRAYNRLKHNRTREENYKKGNLENVLMSLMALFVLNRYLCKKLSQGRVMKEPETKSTLFEMVGWDSYSYIGNGFVNVLRSDGGCSMVYDANMMNS